jgi:ketosteroid isomerase-like protein
MRVVTRGLALAAAFSLWGCAETSPSTTTATPVTARKIDETAARQAVAKVLTEQYVALERGDAAAWAQQLMPDVFSFGAGPGDVMLSRDEVVAFLSRSVKAGGKLAAKSTAMTVALSSDGRAAWASDIVELTLDHTGKTTVVPARLTAVLAEQNGAWWIVALHWSKGTPVEKLTTPGPKAPKLKDVDMSVSPGAQPVVDEFERGLVSTKDFLSAISDRTDALLLGVATEERVEGGTSIKDVLGEQFNQLGVRLRKLGGVHASVTPNGRLGWVAANVELTTPSKARVPVRALAVYLNEGGLWRLVQAHWSVAGESGFGFTKE